jgi:hypothetical protein
MIVPDKIAELQKLHFIAADKHGAATTVYHGLRRAGIVQAQPAAIGFKLSFVIHENLE